MRILKQLIAPIGMLIGGTILTIGSSFQNRQIIDGMKYTHPFIQTFCYFLGESLCYIFFLIRKNDKNINIDNKIKNNNENNVQSQNIQISNTKKQYFPPRYALYPAILDGIAMTLQYCSLTLISPSVYQILRGGVIIITAILSVTILKRKLNNLHIIGLLIVFLGIIIVGISNLIFGLKNQTKSIENNDDNDNNDQVIAYLFIFISLFANGMLFIQEELLIKNHNELQSIDLVGFEGIYGIIFYSIILVILNFIPCSGRFCVFDSIDSIHGTIESIPLFFHQLSANRSLIVSQLIVLFTIGFYAFSAVTVTKNISAMVRSLIDVTRCLFVWIVGIIITLSQDEQQWESTNPIGIVLQTIGFFFIIVGTLIYNQILFKNRQKGQIGNTADFNLSLLDFSYAKGDSNSSKNKDLSSINNNEYSTSNQTNDDNDDVEEEEEY